jgi:hypothetical protein
MKELRGYVFEYTRLSTVYQGKSAFGSFGISDTEWFSDKEMAQEMNAFISSIEQMDNAIAGALSAEKVEAITRALEAQSKRYEFGMEHEGTGGMADIVRDRLEIIAKEIDAGLGAFVESFEGPVEDIMAIIGAWLAATNGASMDINAAIEAAAPKSMMESYLAQGAALRELGDNVGTSAESLMELTTAMGNFQVATIQMVQAIDAAAASIHEMFMTTAENIRMSMMGEEERYNYLQARADALFEQLLTETDPAKIKELAGKIDADINAAWGMLDESQRAALGEQYLERLTVLDETVAEKMEALRDVVIEDAQTNMEMIADRLAELFAVGTEAADVQLEAANIQRETAREGMAVYVRTGDPIVTDHSGG